MEKIKLGKVVDIISGFAFDSRMFNDYSGTPLIRIRDVKRGYTETYTTQDYDKKYIIKNGDILIGMDGEFNIGKWKSKEALLNQRVCKIIPKEINADYLFYLLPKKLKNIESRTAFVTVKHLSVKQIENIEIDLIEMEQQKRVAKKLAMISKIIEIKQVQIKQLNELIKSQFVEMFENCKNIELIGKKIDICRGASPRPINNFITEDVNGENWIKIGDASENSLYITSTKEKITSEGANKSRRVYKGDFILSNSMSYGRPYILGINGCVHDGWLIMSKFQNTFNELYLYYAIRDEYVQNQFAGKVNGATVKNLNSDLVKASFIKIPPIEAQNRFAEFVKQIDKQKFEIQKSLEEMKKLQESLMNKYF